MIDPKPYGYELTVWFHGEADPKILAFTAKTQKAAERRALMKKKASHISHVVALDETAYRRKYCGDRDDAGRFRA